MAGKVNLVDRGRGILTKHDREYLLGQLDGQLSDNAEYQKRHKIRERVRNAIYDFHILSGNLSFEDIDQLFEPAYDWSIEARRFREQGFNGLPEYPLFIDSWSSLFEFFFYSLSTYGIQDSTTLAMMVIEDAIERAVRRYGFDIENKYIKTDARLNINIAERSPLLEYVRSVEQRLPSDSEQSKEILLQMYQKNQIPYSVAVYLYEASLGN